METIELKKQRAKALFDKSGWLLIIPPAALLWGLDPAMFKTLMQWLIFAPILAGVAVIVSRIVFPQINLSTLVCETIKGNVAASLVASTLIAFVAVIICAMVVWSKA
jgi:hypothetical protein